MPGYLTADLMAEYTFSEKLSMKGYLSNLANTLYANCCTRPTTSPVRAGCSSSRQPEVLTMILALPDLLSPHEVQSARQLLADAPWGDGRDSAARRRARSRTTSSCRTTARPPAASARWCWRPWRAARLFSPPRCRRRSFTPRVNRYRGESNAYGHHIDNAIRLLPDGDRVRTDLLPCTVFLSDPDAYDGGELTVADTYGTRGDKLPAGHAVLYPGTSLHQVTPVTRGERLACFFWVQSLVRSDEQRRLLYELDINLLSLRQRHGESAETTALTGTYHNLLRLWADT